MAPLDYFLRGLFVGQPHIVRVWVILFQHSLECYFEDIKRLGRSACRNHRNSHSRCWDERVDLFRVSDQIDSKQHVPGDVYKQYREEAV